MRRGPWLLLWCAACTLNTGGLGSGSGANPGSGSDSGSTSTTNATDGNDTAVLDASSSAAATEGSTSTGPDGSATAAMSSDGPPPPSCGDGVTNDDEACDDMNTDELDGCTSECTLGPLGLVLGELEETVDSFGGWVGATFDEGSNCGDDEVLVGLSGEYGYYFQYFVLAQVRGVCAPVGLVNAVPTALAMGDQVELSLFGTATGTDAFALVCPAGSAAVGIYGASGLYTDRLSVSCRALSLNAAADAVELGAPVDLMPVGTPGLPIEDSVECPAGRVAGGLRVLGDDYATRFHLRCRSLGVELP